MQNSIGTQQKQKITVVIIQNCVRYIIILASNMMGMQKIYLRIIHIGHPGANGQIFKKVVQEGNGQIFKKVVHRENA